MQWRSKFNFRERPTLPQPPAVPAAQTLSHAIRSFHHGYGDNGKDKSENDAKSDDDKIVMALKSLLASKLFS